MSLDPGAQPGRRLGAPVRQSRGASSGMTLCACSRARVTRPAASPGSQPAPLPRVGARPACREGRATAAASLVLARALGARSPGAVATRCTRPTRGASAANAPRAASHKRTAYHAARARRRASLRRSPRRGLASCSALLTACAWRLRSLVRDPLDCPRTARDLTSIFESD